ncbi:MAG TPA: thioredoxin fold domain-containing protein [Candidatus Eisenbacteria bacterium]|jgi:thioredoxin-related protein
MPPSDAPRPGTAAPASAGSRPPRSGATRATPRWLLAVAGALLVARVALGIYEQARPVERPSLVEWRDPVAGQAEARAAGRLALFYFTRDGAPPCRAMNREVFADPRIADAINARLVPIRVLDLAHEEDRNSADVVELEQRYGVTEFPTLVVATPGGPDFLKQAGYPGLAATGRFLSQATARLAMRAQRPPAPDSTNGR